MSFESNFTEYKDYAPPGVRLPEINIEKRYYKNLNLEDSISNFDFLMKLKKKVLTKGKTSKPITTEQKKSFQS